MQHHIMQEEVIVLVCRREACWQRLNPTAHWWGLGASAGGASFVNFTQRLHFTGALLQSAA